MYKSFLFLTSLLLIACTIPTVAEAGPRVLMLSKSAGFEHSVIKRPAEGELSHAEVITKEIVEKMGGTLVATKDASKVNADNLKNYDVVIFITTGDLTQPGTDGQPPMGPNGCQELLDWIKAGGGFVGIHNANDTFHSKGSQIHPYIDMIGGEFATHGKQFRGKLEIVSPGHPAIEGMEDGWRISDEWYISKNLNKEKMHVLALLDPGPERKRQPDKYNIPSYPIIWCMPYGNGRVLYNAMGHREDVWANSAFKSLLVEHINWADGKGKLAAKPNYNKVVPTELPSADDGAKEEPKKKKRGFFRRGGSDSK